MIRLLVNNQEVDLGGDFEVKLTKTIADIREPENRQSDFSKTFTLPGTKTNHRIFSHLFELGYSTSTTGQTNFSPDFNPNLKATARLEVDNVEQLTGFIRVLDIEVTNEQDIVYKCSLHGQLADLFSTIGNGKLSDLDFSEFNHTLTRTNVSNSWATSIIRAGNTESFAYGSGYVHLLVDRGRESNLLWNLEEMTPAIYAKEIVDKIFSAAGYSYSTDSFFNDTYFKHLVVPMPGDGMRESEAAVANKRIGVVRATSAQTGINYGDVLIFNDDSTGDFEDQGGNYSTATGIYTVPAYGQYQNAIDVQVTLTNSGGMTTGRYYFVELGLYVDNTLLATVGHNFGALGIGASITGRIAELIDAPVSLVTGEELTWRLEAVYESTSANMSSPTVLATSSFDISLNVGSSWWCSPLPGGFAYNETLDFTRIYAGNYLQRDFLKSLFMMFNLYAEPDADNPKKLIVKPYGSFYGNTVRDWSAKLDYSQPLKIEPMGELDANPYRFTYKEDKDTANSTYQGLFGSIYGDKVVKIDNDFVRNEKKIEVLFSNTPVSTADGMTLPWIEFDEQKKGGNLRILYYGGLVNSPQWGLSDYEIRGSIISSPPSVSYFTSYPYAGHLDSPSSATADLCFAMPLEVNYPAGSSYTNANLYNTYWRKYINEVTDRDSKVVSGYFRITPADIQKLSFRDLYFFEHQYFRLNKIEDYNANEDGLTYCEFFKVKAVPAHVPLTKRLPGGFDTTDSDGEVYPTIKTPILTGSSGNGGGVYTGGGTGQDGTVFVLSDSVKKSNAAHNVAVVSSKDVYIGPVRNAFVLQSDGVRVTQDDQLFIGQFTAERQWLIGGTPLQVTTSGTTALSTYAADYVWPDYVNCVTASAGAAITIQLPDPTGIDGRQVVIRNEDGQHSVLIEKEDGSTFEGQSTHTLTKQGQSMTWRAVGGEWRRYDSRVTDGGTF